jgi:hypothetical protein
MNEPSLPGSTRRDFLQTSGRIVAASALADNSATQTVSYAVSAINEL